MNSALFSSELVADLILCVGECLVDVMPSGIEQPGGAPANVAYHAAAVGSAVGLVSRIGDDERGRGLRARLMRTGLTEELLQIDELHPTGTVRVRMTGAEPIYDIAEPVAWDFIVETDGAVRAARDAAVVVFGTLAQRHLVSRATIRSLVGQARAAGACVAADLNLRAPFFDEETVLWTLRHADLLKLNREELSVVSQMLGAAGDTMTLFEGLVREFGLCRAVLTCGEDGAWFFEEGRTWRQPAIASEIVDTVGAGDAFTAVLAVGRARGYSLEAVAPLAAEVAAYVVSQPGGMPAWPVALAERARRVLATNPVSP
ncbi:MAG: PfkB family carbohydrate kinase [Chthoniobacterales bacterium]